jgi:anti-sigma B factor antagonist
MSLSNRGSVVTIELGGELDVAAEEDFGSHISTAVSGECDHLVVDLRALEFIDSTGIRLLLEVHALSVQDGFRLWVVGSERDTVKKVFRITGVDKTLPLVGSPPELPS